MSVEYITLIDDYNYKKQEIVPKKIFKEIKKNLVNTLCVEKVNHKKIEHFDILDTQSSWKLI